MATTSNAPYLCDCHRRNHRRHATNRCLARRIQPSLTVSVAFLPPSLALPRVWQFVAYSGGWLIRPDAAQALGVGLDYPPPAIFIKKKRKKEEAQKSCQTPRRRMEMVPSAALIKIRQQLRPWTRRLNPEQKNCNQVLARPRHPTGGRERHKKMLPLCIRRRSNESFDSGWTCLLGVNFLCAAFDLLTPSSSLTLNLLFWVFFWNSCSRHR